MPKKPSTTKQIAEALQTEDKVEQLERIQQLAKVAETPSVAVTVLFAKGGVDVSVAAQDRVSAGDMKYILQAGVDFITRQMVQQELAQPEPPVKDPEMTVEEEERLQETIG